jgi:LmbE family N-acetylglucosaminyl deacetylase
MIAFGHSPGDRALVVATHPDDETLGAGGTIDRLVRSDVEVHVLVITSYMPPGNGRATDSGFREVELKVAAEVLGVAQCGLVWIDDERAQDPGLHLSELVHIIDVSHQFSIQALRPQALLMPADHAFHQDRQAVHTACFAAARPGREYRHTPNIVVGFAGRRIARGTATCSVGRSPSTPRNIGRSRRRHWPATRVRRSTIPIRAASPRCTPSAPLRGPPSEWVLQSCSCPTGWDIDVCVVAAMANPIEDIGATNSVLGRRWQVLPS